MAAPNFANIGEYYAFVCEQFNDVEQFTSPASTGYVDKEASIIQDVDSDFSASMLANLSRNRSFLAAFLDPGNVRANLDPAMAQFGKTIGSTKADTESIFLDLYDYMVSNSQDVNSRALTYGSVSAGGGNTGNGQFLRLTVDENNYNLEGWFADTYTATVVEDARQNGVNFEEVWELEGTDITKDELQRTGTGLFEILRSQSERDSERYIKNPGFELYQVTTPTAGSETTPTEITGWTVTTALSNFRLSVDQLYRTPPGSSTSISLRFMDNDTITQDLVAVNATRIDPDTPYYLAAPIYREGSCDGTLTITLGGVNRAVTMSTLTNGAWNLVPLLSSPGQNYWPANFNQNSLSVSFALASRTTGTFYIDGLQFFPWILVGGGARRGRGGMGTYVLPISGATAYVKGDTQTFTDSESTRGINQYWTAMSGFGYPRS